MKIKSALILCAGYGKRLNPLTLSTPKPLLRFKKLTMLEHTINFIEKLGIKNIKINTFYLEKKINDYVFKNFSEKKIEVISDGNEILGTGGGILNLVKSSEDNNFIVFNPDTFWNEKYLDPIKKMIETYFKLKSENILLIVDKKRSYDKRLRPDFGVNKNKLNIQNKKFIYTGCQIINRNSILHTKKNFSISEIWNKKLKLNNLYGFICSEEFIHLTDLEIYNKLSKND